VKLVGGKKKWVRRSKEVSFLRPMHQAGLHRYRHRHGRRRTHVYEHTLARPDCSVSCILSRSWAYPLAAADVGSIKVDESAPAAADVDDDEKKENDSTSGVAKNSC